MSSSSEPSPQAQNGSISDMKGSKIEEKGNVENRPSVGEENDNKNNKTRDKDNELMAKAREALNTILPSRKMDQIEELGRQYGKDAIRYISEIGEKSSSPRVKDKALKTINDILNDQT